MSEVVVDIWSDIACPWCFLGKKRFEEAAEDFASRTRTKVLVRHHSYELSPETPPDFDGAEAEIQAQRKGLSPQEMSRMFGQITDLGRLMGLEFRFDRTRVANTHKAHELVHFAAAEGKEDEMIEILYRAHFTEGIWIGGVDQLVELAQRAGLDPEQARAALESGSYARAVDADEDAARQIGITGVPFFVIGERYGVSGAQPAEVFTEALERVVTEGLVMVNSGGPAGSRSDGLAGQADCSDGTCAI